MKSKRRKAARSPVNAVTKPAFEQCWYCELNADPGAQAAIVLVKRDEDFSYFASGSEDQKEVVTQVEIPRCAECRLAHQKVGDPLWFQLLIGFGGVALLGVYFGIFIKTLPWWIYLLIGLAVSGAVIGIAIAASRNLFTLPGHIKEIDDVGNQKQVEALVLKGWKVKK